MRVLVVEDHRELAATIAVGLRREGMAVDIVHDGRAALEHIGRDRYDVVVLDRDLPQLHGDEVCRSLVAGGAGARVLMLTAADTIENRVDGLSLGADDYLPKPFAFAELVARIRALARRVQPALPPVLTVADIRLDTGQRVASRAGRRCSSFCLPPTVPRSRPRSCSSGLGTSTSTRSVTSSRSRSAACAASWASLR
jgi:DNA-binding response OmpR family regulator